jgi:indolepyruvate decarboxylase
MAPMLIDYALTQCITERRPVYIELLQDIVNLKCEQPRLKLEPAKILSDKAGLDSSIQMIKDQLKKAAHPIIWIGVEIDRFGLREKTEKLLRTLKLPYVSELLSKGALSENDELFAGVFDGPASSPGTQELTKNADFVLAMGVWLTDINDLAAQADLSKTAFVSLNTVKFGAYFSAQVALGDLIDGLQAASLKCKPQPLPKKTAVTAFNAKPTDTITYQGFYDFIQHSNFINEDTIIGADSSLNYFGSLLLKVDAPRSYIIQSSYSAIGYIGPAATGLSLAKNADQRVIVFSGDGGFQMSAQCLSTQTRFGLNPIIFVIDNGVYGVEQWLADASVFDKDTATGTAAIESNASANKKAEEQAKAPVNTSVNTAGSAIAGTSGNTTDKTEGAASQNSGKKQFYNSCIIHRWKYSKLANVFGCQGWEVNTYAELEAAIKGALANENSPSIIQVVVPDKSIPYNAEWKIKVDSKPQ